MIKKLPFKVAKDRLVPASGWVKDLLRARKYKLGDVVFCVITKPRNPKFNGLVHAGFAQMLINNLDTFSHMTPHEVLKRLQIEAGICCDEIGVVLDGLGPAIYRVPMSMSFESMGQDEFSDLFGKMCEYVAQKYWPELNGEQVAEMAKEMQSGPEA